MTSKRDNNPFTPPIYDGDQDKDRLPYEGPPIRTKAEKINRGKRAVREGSGVVSGSGAAAGGTGGIEEGFDNNPVGGDGPGVMPAAPPMSEDEE